MNMLYMMGNCDCFPTSRWRMVACVTLDSGGGSSVGGGGVVGGGGLGDDLDGWDAVALSENPGVVWISVVFLVVGQRVW